MQQRHLINEKPEVIDSYDKLFTQLKNKEASKKLRTNVKVLDFISTHNIPQNVVDDLLEKVSKYPIEDMIEDAQGRLTIVTNRPTGSNKVMSINPFPAHANHPTHAGQFKVDTYRRGYVNSLNQNIDVPLSDNKLVPNYQGNSQTIDNYVHPLQGGEKIEITMSGINDREIGIDAIIARHNQLNSGPNVTADDFDFSEWVVHHMDDMTPQSDGTFKCSVQLVDVTAHNNAPGISVSGMQHTGASAQWRAHHGSGY